LGNLDRLEQWLDEEERARLEEHRKLVLADAPKNRFSITTGEIRMIEAVRQEIEIIRRSPEP